MELTAKNGLIALQTVGNKLPNLLIAVFIILFSSVTIVTVMTTPNFYSQLFGAVNPRYIGFIIFFVLFSVVMTAAVPLFVNKFILRKSVSEIGWRAPRSKTTAYLLTIMSFAYTIPAFIYLAQQPAVKQFYTYGACSIYLFIGTQLILFPIYYFAEELFFRGFIFLNLWERIGWHSFWISDILFTVAHFGKPPLEIAISIPMSVLLNFITLRTRSIYPAFFVHTFLGILIFTLINGHAVYW